MAYRSINLKFLTGWLVVGFMADCLTNPEPLVQQPASLTTALFGRQFLTGYSIIYQYNLQPLFKISFYKYNLLKYEIIWLRNDKIFTILL